MYEWGIDDVNEADLIVDEIVESVEQSTGKSIFAIKKLDDDIRRKNRIKIIVVFTDRTVLQGFIFLKRLKDSIEVRIAGKYI